MKVLSFGIMETVPVVDSSCNGGVLFYSVRVENEACKGETSDKRHQDGGTREKRVKAEKTVFGFGVKKLRSRDPTAG